MLHNRLAQLREERANGEGGFTLIELLVVVVIIGVLIAIAIPLYLNYRKGANDKGAQSDLRGAVSTFETCYADNNNYPLAGADAGYTFGSTSTTASTAFTTKGCTQTVNTSAGTTLTYFSSPGTGTVGTTAVPNYLIIGINANGNATGGTNGYYCYSSKAGGSVVKRSSTQPTAYADACPTT